MFCNNLILAFPSPCGCRCVCPLSWDHQNGIASAGPWRFLPGPPSVRRLRHRLKFEHKLHKILESKSSPKQIPRCVKPLHSILYSKKKIFLQIFYMDKESILMNRSAQITLHSWTKPTSCETVKWFMNQFSMTLYTKLV